MVYRDARCERYNSRFGPCWKDDLPRADQENVYEEERRPSESDSSDCGYGESPGGGGEVVGRRREFLASHVAVQLRLIEFAAW